jgi:uncharacterized protein (TIGR01777 family)
VVFEWHRRPGALERLTPPWETAEVVSRTGGIEQSGSLITLQVRMGPFRRLWVSEHRDYQEGRQFRDIQVQGPFASWAHTHRFEPIDAGSSILEDQIEYELPLGWVGRLLGRSFVREKLERLFHYRHRTTTQDLESHLRIQTARAMKILVSGSSGFIGSSLVPFLTTGGHEVIRLSRTKPNQDETVVRWDPVRRQIDLSHLDGVDAVVHLAGENLGTGRWSRQKKHRIRTSRVEGTRFLCESLTKLPNPPRVLVSASAVGYYGSRGDEVLDEQSQPGSGFLSEVCRGWEEATEPARQIGVRVVNLRIGAVLSPAGGALAQMLPPFKAGLGGQVGSGNQYMSWISIEDLVGLILFVLREENLVGPVNAVAPHPVTNRELTKTLGRVLRRPTAMALPTFAARLAFGEVADELLLASARVNPSKLLGAGYEFRHPRLETALRHVLGKAEADE